jgi:hypothetical protein
MLDRDNNHNGSCEFASELVDYMYGEIAESGRNTFDAHLPGCESCTAELAGISSARLSVMEWRAAEFDSLKTPAIVIPYDKVERDAEQGWLASLRGFFASSPGWAAAAAIVPISVVCLGVALFTFDLFGPVEVARQDNSSSNTPTPTRKSNPGVSNPQTPPEVAASKPAQDKDLTDESIEKPAPTSVKAAERPTSRTRKAKTVSADTPAKVVDQTQPPTQRRRAPRLNNFEDEEDDSLRLADLFAQTDTED